MKIVKGHDLQWADKDKTQINMKIETDQHGIIPYTAHKDFDNLGLFKEAVSGKHGEIKPFALPQVPREAAEAIKRFQAEMKQKEKMQAELKPQKEKMQAAKAKSNRPTTEKSETT